MKKNIVLFIVILLTACNSAEEQNLNIQNINTDNWCHIEHPYFSFKMPPHWEIKSVHNENSNFQITNNRNTVIDMRSLHTVIPPRYPKISKNEIKMGKKIDSLKVTNIYKKNDFYIHVIYHNSSRGIDFYKKGYVPEIHFFFENPENKEECFRHISLGAFPVLEYGYKYTVQDLDTIITLFDTVVPKIVQKNKTSENKKTTYVSFNRDNFFNVPTDETNENEIYMDSVENKEIKVVYIQKCR
ncbi:hypothetical protein [Hugenholtzia roseola]|uniref:hypothetical protein n=1 Tax=Hugenholtzia roseola TaxID=1002 RepID=UPI00040E8396|nr:hypothetical protein [Hugenholtzia roseola]